jgi:hypothetical protein
MRTDLYSFIHKAQRFHLFTLANAIGGCDPTDAAATATLATEVRSIIEHLRDHARNEEAYIHPLFERIAAPPKVLEAEHQDLEAALAGLGSILDAKQWDALYPAFHQFVAGYLLHMAAEERAQREILWPNLPEADMTAVFQRFKAERPPALARADLVFMLPALNVLELTGMYRGMKASAPPPAFQGACALAAATLDTPCWERVLAAI